MAHYFFTEKSYVQNLTACPITTYDSNGNFITFNPTHFSQNTIFVYLVDKNQYQALRDKGVPDEKLFRPCYEGIGRDNIRVNMLINCKDNKTRLICHGE